MDGLVSINRKTQLAPKTTLSTTGRMLQKRSRLHVDTDRQDTRTTPTVSPPLFPDFFSRVKSEIETDVEKRPSSGQKLSSDRITLLDRSADTPRSSASGRWEERNDSTGTGRPERRGWVRCRRPAQRLLRKLGSQPALPASASRGE